MQISACLQLHLTMCAVFKMYLFMLSQVFVVLAISVAISVLIAERLSARLLILQCVFSVGGVWCHASEMQLKVWLVRKHPSHLGMQLKDPVNKSLFILA